MRFLFPAALLFLVVAPAFAADPSISEVKATAKKQQITVSFQLKGAFETPELMKAAQSGAPTGFTYKIQLYRSRPNWFDQKLDEARIDVIANFDSTTREWVLTYRRNRKLVRSQSFTDFAGLKEKMTSILEEDLFTTAYRPYKLLVRVRAEVIRGYLFYIVPWDVETEWKEARVKVVEGGR